MKQGFHNAISLLMAVLVLASTLSFTVDMHYCGDHLVDFSLLQAKTCGMEPKVEHQSSTPDSCAPQVAQKSCCSDKQFKVDGQEDLKPSFTDFHVNEQLFIASFAYSYLYLFEDVEVDFTPFQKYRPPHLTRDVQLLHESFLI
ncbi:HYC_CC_PP family protein [Flavimarina sp. Hel_I_48]|uniref:HYC_CC_PP family protein n=1 Tax=Flavimarina sp. Hel_I_48 TaxID=1392488 RepID=UPI0004DF007C|nr:hypothetical protein [Flavimarina sp. Hel_I_48]